MKAVLKSWDNVAEALTALAELTAVVKKEEATMNDKINDIRSKFEEKTEKTRNEMNQLENAIEGFALANKGEFEKVRTKEFGAGDVGYRNNPPKVTTLSKKFTIKTATEFVKQLMPKYLRTKEEINKEAILGEYASKALTDSDLAKVGLRVDQDETFFINLKWEELANDKRA